MGEIAEFNPSSTLPNEFEYVDLESVIGTDLVTHRAEKKSTAPSRAQRLAQKGDVFYQTVRPYQKNNYLYDLPYDNFVFSTGYAQMRPNIDSYFLLSHIQGEKFVKRVLDRCTGTSYPAINSTDLAEINIQVPTKLDEQIQIGKFFKDIEIIITLHQRKYDALLKLKEAYLQNMFPEKGESIPKVRFANFVGDWEQRKLGDITSLITKGTTPKDKSWIGTVNYVKTESIDSISGNITIKANTSIEEHEGYLKRSQLKEKDILFSIVGTLGRVGIVESKDLPANTNQQIAIIRLKNSKTNFILNALKTNYIQSFIKSDSTIGAQPSLSLWQINNLKISVPNFEEQKEIGAFFKQLDNFITLHQHKLEKLKHLKEAYLQKMFV